MSSYQVMARKWRPQTFDDVVGQDHVVRTLKNAITRGRIAHAYLLVGPRGTGKTSLARIFAKALNCTGGPKVDFSEDDPAVKAIADGTHLDVIEIDGASNNGVDQVRDLRDTARYSPAQGRFKIYIIDEVHMLSAQAFNALLKTLEEPPPHVKFVFATTDVQKVLPTILSRCQRFDLRPIPAELIAGRLRKIAQAEEITVTESALASIARLADGGMRDAQSILDQMISFCGNQIAEADLLDVYGLVSEEKVAELAGALAAGDHAKIVAIVDECDANGRDLVRLLGDVQALIRSALLDAIAQGGKSGRLGAALTTEQLTRMLDALREGEGNLKFGLTEKINFEVTLLKVVEASRSRAIDSLIRELAAISGGAPADPGEKKKDLIAEIEAGMRGEKAAPAGGDGGEVGPAPLRQRRDAAAAEPESSGPGRTEAAANASDLPGGAAVGPDGPLESNWPGETEEAGFLAGVREKGSSGPPAPSGAPAAAENEPAPPVEELLRQIPKELLSTLDELFRARFTRVMRAKPKAPVSTP